MVTCITWRKYGNKLKEYWNRESEIPPKHHYCNKVGHLKNFCYRIFKFFKVPIGVRKIPPGNRATTRWPIINKMIVTRGRFMKMKIQMTHNKPDTKKYLSQKGQAWNITTRHLLRMSHMVTTEENITNLWYTETRVAVGDIGTIIREERGVCNGYQKHDRKLHCMTLSYMYIIPA